MKVLKKLHVIEKEKCIYDIHYCKAGVGFIFYHKEKDDGNWEKALDVDRYYETFEKAVNAEYDKLKKEGKE